MGFLAQKLGGFVAPEGIINPGFRYTAPLGPKFAEDALVYCARREGSVVKVFDRDCDSVCNVVIKERVRPDGDLTFFAFDASEAWILIYGNDLEVGILFSNENPGSLLDNLDIDKARANFFDSFEVRRSEQKGYYDQAFLMAWIKLATSGRSSAFSGRHTN